MKRILSTTGDDVKIGSRKHTADEGSVQMIDKRTGEAYTPPYGRTELFRFLPGSLLFLRRAFFSTGFSARLENQFFTI